MIQKSKKQKEEKDPVRLMQKAFNSSVMFFDWKTKKAQKAIYKDM